MSRTRRRGDRNTNGVQKRSGLRLEGWRSLFQVRRGDLTRIIRSLPIVLPLLAALLLAGLSVVNTRYYHDQALVEVEAEAERAAAAMNAYIKKVVSRVEARAALLAQASAQGSAVSEALPDAIFSRLVALTDLGIADNDNADLNNLRHIERDMLRRSAEDGKTVIDVYRDKSDWLFSVASPAGENRVLLVSFPVGVLREGLSAPATGLMANYALQYKLYKTWRALTQRGASEPSPVLAQARLQYPQWAVQVTLGQLSYQQRVNRNLWLYVAAIIAGAAALLELILSLHRLRAHRRNQKMSDLLDTELREKQESEEDSLIEAVFDATRSAWPRKASGNAGAFNREHEEQSTRDRVQALDDAASAPAEDELRNVGQTAEVDADTADLEDDDFLDILGEPDLPDERPSVPTVAATDSNAPIDDTIFRAYDIRGIANTQLTDEVCRDIGRALGAELVSRRQRQTLLARDGRNSSPRIRDSLVEGLLWSGVDVIDLGAVPTPVMHFATHELGIGNGVMITGSHNAREYNGVKLVIQRRSLTEEAIHALRDRIKARDFHQAAVAGEYSNQSVVNQYIERIKGDVLVARRMRVVVDAANGVTGPLAPRVLQALGCNVEPLFCELDGDFPNHDPDPTRPGNLKTLQATVRGKRADLGIALDGDGDRVVFVTSSGDVVYPDQALMVLAQDVVARNPAAPIVYDVKCSKHLPALVTEAGGLPIMCRSGHSYVKNQLELSNALLGGEFTGHIFFKERWYGFDDGIYVAARMLELLSLSPVRLNEHLGRLPRSSKTPEISVPCDEVQKFVIVEQLKSGGFFDDGEVNTLDGLRVEFADGWGLVRASNTGPALSLRFEADTRERLADIMERFRLALNAVDPTLSVDF